MNQNEQQREKERKKERKKGKRAKGTKRKRSSIPRNEPQRKRT